LKGGPRLFGVAATPGNRNRKMWLGACSAAGHAAASASLPQELPELTPIRSKNLQWMFMRKENFFL